MPNIDLYVTLISLAAGVCVCVRVCVYLCLWDCGGGGGRLHVMIIYIVM